MFANILNSVRGIFQFVHERLGSLFYRRALRPRGPLSRGVREPILTSQAKDLSLSLSCFLSLPLSLCPSFYSTKGFLGFEARIFNGSAARSRFNWVPASSSRVLVYQAHCIGRLAHFVIASILAFPSRSRVFNSGFIHSERERPSLGFARVSL